MQVRKQQSELDMEQQTGSKYCHRAYLTYMQEISPGISLEGMILKLKLQYFGHLMRRADSLEKTLMLGGMAGRRKRGGQRMRAGWHH